jgi:3'(2'), 5'-bisphosphate nucleotidase/inositol polyphosphate 1-phosphatase
VALGLLDDGEVVAGVLGCPNLPLTSIASGVSVSPGQTVGCIFAATKGQGTFMQSIDGSVPAKRVGLRIFVPSVLHGHPLSDGKL